MKRILSPQVLNFAFLVMSKINHHNIVMGSRTSSRGRIPRSGRCCVVVALLGLLLVFLSFLAMPSNPAGGTAIPKWNPKLMHNRDDRCQATLISPFRVGCPNTCRTQRSIPHEEDEPPMFRMAVMWTFGSMERYNPNDLDASQSSFKCPIEMVQSFVTSQHRLSGFVAAESQKRGLNSTEKTTSSGGTMLFIKPQKKMHLSLAYLCCIREEEKKTVHLAVQNWVAQRAARLTKDIELRFNKLQCWKERKNSITNIIVNDETTQKALLLVYMDLVEFIRNAVPSYDPMVVPRQDQMPFHITLAGVYYGSNEDGNSIDPLLPVMAEVTQSISQDTDWFPTTSKMTLSFLPNVTNPVKHNPK